MLDKRIDILNRTAADDGDFGLDSGGVTWEKTCSAWASVSFVKGVLPCVRARWMPTVWSWCG